MITYWIAAISAWSILIMALCLKRAWKKADPFTFVSVAAAVWSVVMLGMTFRNEHSLFEKATPEQTLMSVQQLINEDDYEEALAVLTTDLRDGDVERAVLAAELSVLAVRQGESQEDDFPQTEISREALNDTSNEASKEAVDENSNEMHLPLAERLRLAEQEVDLDAARDAHLDQAIRYIEETQNTGAPGIALHLQCARLYYMDQSREQAAEELRALPLEQKQSRPGRWLSDPWAVYVQKLREDKAEQGTLQPNGEAAVDAAFDELMTQLYQGVLDKQRAPYDSFDAFVKEIVWSDL